MAQNKTGFDPTQTAEYWLEKKVYTVPLRSRSKRPKARDWPHLRLVEEDLQNGAFKRGDNIGALWGDASDHATDIDLDMEEAIWVAEHILPETFIYGRSGKEYSHSHSGFIFGGSITSLPSILPLVDHRFSAEMTGILIHASSDVNPFVRSPSL